MVCFPLALAADPDAKAPAAAAQAPASEATAPKPAPTAKDVCLAALDAVKRQPGYHARYTAGIHKTGSDPFEQEGAAVRQGELLYREGRRPKAPDLSVKLYRLRDRIAVFDFAHEQWLTDKQVGDPTLGKALEDPDVAMDFLQSAMDDAIDATPMKPDPDNPGRKKPELVNIGGVPCRVYELKINKETLAKKVQKQYQAAEDLDWETAEVSAQILVGGEPALPRKFVIDSILPERGKDDAKEKVHVKVHVEVEVTDYSDRPAPAPPKDAREILEAK